MPALDSRPRPPLLIDTLQWRAAHTAGDEAFTFLVDGETDEESITYAELDRRARAIAVRLQSLGGPGERALLLCPAGLDFIAAFFGCLYAGFVAVPAYAPDPPRQIETLRPVARSSRPLTGITTRAALPAIRQAFQGDGELGGLSWLSTDELPAGSETHWCRPDITPDDLAYLVYTSGSTSEPKGVMIAYRNFPPVLEEAYRARGQQERVMIWMPHHTAGAINWGMIIPVMHGIPVTFMAPEAFSERPARWIAAIARTRATHSPAPNFAYDLVVDAIPREERQRYDLSCWRFAFNWGEQVRAETIERFESAFAAGGLHSGVTISGYGLSEVYGVAIARPERGLTILSFDREQLEESVVALVDGGDRRGRSLVGQGPISSDLELLIVDPASQTRCAPNQVGEIWVRGSSVVAGYWDAPEATRHAFHAHLATDEDRADESRAYFRTGDLGFLYGGELFLTGRQKELIIAHGRNIYPVDVELAARRSHSALQSQAGAAFAVDDGGEERLVVVQEVEATPDPGALAAAVRRGIASDIGVRPHAVVLVPPRSIPRTPTGKIRHAACRELFLSGRLPALHPDATDDGSPDRRVPYVPPTSPTEQALVEIWERVLGVSPVGIYDDFVDLGGDSLRSLQVLARMRERGMYASLEQIQRHGAVAALAQAMDGRPAPASDDGPLVGPVPMLLTNYSALGNSPEPPRNLLAIYSFTTAEPLDPELLNQAARRVVFHHDALRMQLTYTGERWEAACVAHTPNRIVSYTDLSDAPAEDRERLMDIELERLRNRIDIRRAELLQIGLFHLGAGAPDRFVVFVSHVAIDAFCSRVLVSDLETAYLQLRAGQPLQLPAKTTSLRRWGEAVRVLAASEEMRAEIPYWLQVTGGRPAVIPPDIRNGDEGGAVCAVWSPLGAEPTSRLLRSSPQREGFGIGEAFLAAAARAVAYRGWDTVPGPAGHTGSHSVLLDTLHHGREPLAPDIDLSRTLGYFTTNVPVRLELDPGASPAASAASVRAQLERIPRHGLGFAVLRYLCPHPICSSLRTRYRLIEMNYVGVLDRAYDGLSLFRTAVTPPSNARFPAPRMDRLRIRGSVVGGSLHIGVEYHDHVYARATAEGLIAGALADLEEIAARP